MIDPKRKKIYIVLIVVCILASAGVLIYGGVFSSPKTGTSPVLTTIPTTTKTGTPTENTTTTATSSSGSARGGNVTYSAPAVFPVSSAIDSSVLSSLEKFNQFQPVQIDSSMLGRENPFTNY